MDRADEMAYEVAYELPGFGFGSGSKSWSFVDFKYKTRH